MFKMGEEAMLYVGIYPEDCSDYGNSLVVLFPILNDPYYPIPNIGSAITSLG